MTVRQKLAWLGSAYLEGLLIVHKKLDRDVANKVRVREQKRRNKYNSLVENVRKALENKNAGLKYKNVWKAFNIEGMTVARRVYQPVGAYSTMTIAILIELGDIADTS